MKKSKPLAKFFPDDLATSCEVRVLWSYNIRLRLACLGYRYRPRGHLDAPAWVSQFDLTDPVRVRDDLHALRCAGAWVDLSGLADYMAGVCITMADPDWFCLL